jgi:hypothetical protein
VFKGSGTKYWFECDKCSHKFKCTPNHVNHGCWCPQCIHKTEAKLHKWLLKLYPDTIYQFRIYWCCNPTTGRCLPFDFVIPSLQVIIELDGRQHYEQIANWRSPDEQGEVDRFKEKQALDNEFTVVRLYQPDVLNDLNEWEEMTMMSLYLHEEPEVIDMAKRR